MTTAADPYRDPQHFLDECADLERLLVSLPAPALDQPSAFKGWTPNRILHHLHCWNRAAGLSLDDGDGFRAWYAKTLPHRAAGTLDLFERDESDGLSGAPLIEAWSAGCRTLAAAYAATDPKARVDWAGLLMSARSSVTARLMETWAHGQAVYDLAGKRRVCTDRLHGIAVLGVNTFGWTFKNRGLQPPGPPPHVVLTAPSGAVWTFGEPSAAERVEGSAEEFCQVVAQTRNIADTRLRVTGPTATAWMAIAQCFAGPPESPPRPGQRRPAGPPPA